MFGVSFPMAWFDPRIMSPLLPYRTLDKDWHFSRSGELLAGTKGRDTEA